MHVINELLLELFSWKIECFEQLLVLIVQLNVFGGVNFDSRKVFQTLGLARLTSSKINFRNNGNRENQNTDFR